jgi:phasin family protein
MSNSSESLVDIFRQFVRQFGLPEIEVDTIIEAQRKNIDALGQSVQVASEGAAAVAAKQKEVIEAALREITADLREFKPFGDPRNAVTNQTELAKKAFDAAIGNTRDVAQLIQQSLGDVTKIIQDRMKEGAEELRASLSMKR